MLAYVNSAVAVCNATMYGRIIFTVFESRTVSELTPPKRARSRSAKLHAFLAAMNGCCEERTRRDRETFGP